MQLWILCLSLNASLTPLLGSRLQFTDLRSPQATEMALDGARQQLVEYMGHKILTSEQSQRELNGPGVPYFSSHLILKSVLIEKPHYPV